MNVKYFYIVPINLCRVLNINTKDTGCLRLMGLPLLFCHVTKGDNFVTVFGFPGCDSSSIKGSTLTKRLKYFLNGVNFKKYRLCS